MKAELKEMIIQKIVDPSWADIEELTFPPIECNNEQTEHLNEWLDEFFKRLEQHVRGVFEDGFPMNEHTCEKCDEKQIKFLNYYDHKKELIIYFCHYCGEVLRRVKISEVNPCPQSGNNISNKN